jgi:hypothetical protein
MWEGERVPPEPAARDLKKGSEAINSLVTDSLETQPTSLEGAKKFVGSILYPNYATQFF